MKKLLFITLLCSLFACNKKADVENLVPITTHDTLVSPLDYEYRISYRCEQFYYNITFVIKEDRENYAFINDSIVFNDEVHSWINFINVDFRLNIDDEILYFEREINGSSPYFVREASSKKYSGDYGFLDELKLIKGIAGADRITFETTDGVKIQLKDIKKDCENFLLEYEKATKNKVDWEKVKKDLTVKKYNEKK
jgi:hypothetical protein